MRNQSVRPKKMEQKPIEQSGWRWKEELRERKKNICINFVWNFMHSFYHFAIVSLSTFISGARQFRTLELQLIQIFMYECGSDWHTFDSVHFFLQMSVILGTVRAHNSCIDEQQSGKNRTNCNSRASNPSCSTLQFPLYLNYATEKHVLM